MPGIDASITAGIGSGAQLDPMATLYRFAATQNALNQNALFQQTYRARQAMGPLAQQSVNPETGEMDWNRFATLVSTHPDTAWMAPDVLNTITQKKLTDAQIVNQKLMAAEKRMSVTGPVLAAASVDPDVNVASDMGKYASELMSMGAFEKNSDAIRWLTNISPLKGADLRNQLRQMAASSQSGQEALGRINGQYTEALFHDANGNPAPGWMSTTMRSTTPAVPFMGAGGQASATGAAAAPAPALAGGGAGQAQPTAPAAPVAPSQPTTMGGSPLTLGPVGPVAKAGLDTLSDYQKGVNDEATFAYKSEQLVGELRNALKGIKTGAGTSAYVEAAKLAQAFGVSDKYVDEVAGGNLGHLQEASKLMLRLATGDLRTALLPGAGRLTNTEFTAYREANPNWDTDPRAISKLLDFTHRMNMLAIRKSQSFALARGAATRGEAMPEGLQDITQFEPYWIGKLEKNGWISGDTAASMRGEK